MVYLVSDAQTNEQKALKISRDMLALVREFTILEKLNKLAAGSELVPRVELMDDGVITGHVYGFIIMEYIEGLNLRNVLRCRTFSPQEIYALAKLFGTLLKILHNCGYVYGDLKPENILFDTKRAVFRLVDFGGVREIGNAITQFTPAFDRASYDCGTRQADPGYDAFALAALMVALATGKDPQPKSPEVSGTPAMIAAVWKKARQKKLWDVAELVRGYESHLYHAELSSWRIKAVIYGLGVFSLIFFSLTLMHLLH